MATKQNVGLRPKNLQVFLFRHNITSMWVFILPVVFNLSGVVRLIHYPSCFNMGQVRFLRISILDV